MVTVLSVQPPAVARDGPSLAPATGRPPPPGAETARALRPPERPAMPADLRPPTRAERLVGPPPAFRINLLQHIRETGLSAHEPDGGFVPGSGGGAAASHPSVPGENGGADADDAAASLRSAPHVPDPDAPPCPPSVAMPPGQESPSAPVGSEARQIDLRL